MSPPPATPPPALEALAEALGHVLGETCRLARLTRCAAWNADGPGAPVAGPLLRAQAAELDGALDPIAGHLRGLGFSALPLYPEGGEDALRLMAGAPGPALRRLREAQHRLGLSVAAAMDVARAGDEAATLVLLAARIEAQRAQTRELGQLGAPLSGRTS